MYVGHPKLTPWVSTLGIASVYFSFYVFPQVELRPAISWSIMKNLPSDTKEAASSLLTTPVKFMRAQTYV